MQLWYESLIYFVEEKFLVTIFTILVISIITLIRQPGVSCGEVSRHFAFYIMMEINHVIVRHSHKWRLNLKNNTCIFTLALMFPNKLLSPDNEATPHISKTNFDKKLRDWKKGILFRCAIIFSTEIKIEMYDIHQGELRIWTCECADPCFF